MFGISVSPSDVLTSFQVFMLWNFHVKMWTVVFCNISPEPRQDSVLDWNQNIQGALYAISRSVRSLEFHCTLYNHCTNTLWHWGKWKKTNKPTKKPQTTQTRLWYTYVYLYVCIYTYSYESVLVMLSSILKMSQVK